MTPSIREAWDIMVAKLGVNHPTIAPHCSEECNSDLQREKGYWPEPWVEMPRGGLPFDEFDSIVTPAANGTETLVLSFEVPFGYDGIILSHTNVFTGPGFTEGSGNLVWRIRIGNPSLQGRPQRNYQNITTTRGDLTEGRTVYGGMSLSSGDFAQYSVTHAVLSPIVPAGTRIICNLAGFYWPRGSSPMRSSAR